jgi:hypothetical protein
MDYLMTHDCFLRGRKSNVRKNAYSVAATCAILVGHYEWDQGESHREGSIQALEGEHDRGGGAPI